MAILSLKAAIHVTTARRARPIDMDVVPERDEVPGANAGSDRQLITLAVDVPRSRDEEHLDGQE
jgi:hypothetical protein